MSRLLLFQRLDYGLYYSSPTLHLLVTTPLTSTWFSHSPIYSLPSASQMFKLNKLLLFHFSLIYAALPFCSSSDPLPNANFACKHPHSFDCFGLSESHREVTASLAGEGEAQAVFTQAIDQLSDSQTSELLI